MSTSDPDIRITVVDSDSLDEAELGVVAFNLHLLRHHPVAPVDLFIPRIIDDKGTVDLIPFVLKGHRPDERMVDLLESAGMDTVYCPVEESAALLKHLQAGLGGVLADPGTELKEKSRHLYEHAKLLGQVIISDPPTPQAVAMGSEYVEQVMGFIDLNRPEGEKALVEMMQVDYTLYTHSVNVALFAVNFAGFLGLPEQQRHLLGLGGIFHDVGKTRIDKAILGKRGPLNREEWKVMRRHPEEGAAMMRGVEGFPLMAMGLVKHHHENLDGSGYPQRLLEHEIPPLARILRIIDAFDAMTSDRAYKKAWRAREALVTLRSDAERRRLDESLFNSFVKYISGVSRGRD